MRSQTDRELAEMIAKFRTPPGLNWDDLANDIETVLKTRSQSTVPIEITSEMIEAAANAMRGVCPIWNDEWPGTDASMHEDFINMARAALEAAEKVRAVADYPLGGRTFKVA